MNFRQLAYNNVIRNKSIYVGYFLSSTFAALNFFIHCILAYHPYFSHEEFGELMSTSTNASIKIGFELARDLILVFSFLFILYSISTFFVRRKRELGILLVYGMSNYQLKKLIFIENLVIGFFSTLTGIGIGLIFMKLILLFCESLFMLQGKFEFYFPKEAIIRTFISFLIIFILTSIFITRKIKAAQLIKLTRSGEIPKPEPKISIWLALLAIILIITSYAAAFYMKFAAQKGFLYGYLMIMCLFIIGVLGTYFLFTQFSFYVIHGIKNKMKIYLNKTNILTISELSYRMTDNARALFLMSILFSVALTAIGQCLAIGELVTERHSPYAFNYKSYKGNLHEDLHVSQIKKQLETFHFLYVLVSPIRVEEDLDMIKLEDYNKCMAILGYPLIKLNNEKESFIIPSKATLKIGSTKELEEKFKQIKFSNDQFHFTLFAKKLLIKNELAPLDRSLVVVSNSIYNQMKNSLKIDENYYNEYSFFIKNWKDTREASKELMKTIPITEGKPKDFFEFDSEIYNWLSWTRSTANRNIMSVLVGIVFFAFAMSFLYFRLFADFERDEKQYGMLFKLGLTQEECKRIVTKQIAIFCFIPMIVAIIHSSMALLALQYLEHAFDIPISIKKSAIMVFIVFICMQIIYFLLVRKRYLQYLLRTK
ncbi:FtsX-like permease family protein [Bacillus cereus]